MAELQPIIVFHAHNFVHHFGICHPISVKLLQLMSGAITQNSVKNKVSILINGGVTSNYSVSRPPFWPPSWNLLSDLCQTSKTDVRCHSAQFSEKNVVSLLINGWVSAKYSVSRQPFCPPSWNLLSDLCKTLIDYVRCYSEQFKKKRRIYLGTHTHRHTHTHTLYDRIRRNAMRCFSPKNTNINNVLDMQWRLQSSRQ